MRFWGAFSAVLLIALAAHAEAPTGLALPLDCTPDEDCWIRRYVDLDPGQGAQDYMCGDLTSDGHNGTDFAIRNLAAMADGVRVRAAAGGVVEALRDGVEDVSVDEIGKEAVAGKECGNGIRIALGDGWTTMYCHLRRGSLMVAEGDRVAAGQPLGLIGLSGESNFPHVHFELRHGDEPVDPFVGSGRAAACGPGDAPLWRPDVMAALAYRPIVLTNAGVATAPPELEEVSRGWHGLAQLPTTVPALVLWVEGLGFQAGDDFRFALTAPDGTRVIERSATLERATGHWLQFAGAKRPQGGWPPGVYRGEVTVERPGIAPVAIARTVEIEAP